MGNSRFMAAMTHLQWQLQGVEGVLHLSHLQLWSLLSKLTLTQSDWDNVGTISVKLLACQPRKSPSNKEQWSLCPVVLSVFTRVFSAINQQQPTERGGQDQGDPRVLWQGQGHTQNSSHPTLLSANKGHVMHTANHHSHFSKMWPSAKCHWNKWGLSP